MTSLALRTQHRWPHDARCVVGLTLDFDGTSLERGRDQLPYGARSHGRGGPLALPGDRRHLRKADPQAH